MWSVLSSNRDCSMVWKECSTATARAKTMSFIIVHANESFTTPIQQISYTSIREARHLEATDTLQITFVSYILIRKTLFRIHASVPSCPSVSAMTVIPCLWPTITNIRAGSITG